MSKVAPPYCLSSFSLPLAPFACSPWTAPPITTLRADTHSVLRLFALICLQLPSHSLAHFISVSQNLAYFFCLRLVSFCDTCFNDLCGLYKYIQRWARAETTTFSRE